jgi:lysophospholipase L1-like esterase
MNSFIYIQITTNGDEMMQSIKPTLLILLLICSLSVAHAEPITLVAIGDSLTQGDGDLEVGGGYPARLATRLNDSHPGSVVKNLGQSGWTSDDLINTQLEPALGLLNSAPTGHTKIAIVWIGSNDLFGLYNYVCDEEYRNKFSACEGDGLRIFSDNIQRILSALKGTGARLYIALLDDQSKRPVMTDQEKRTSSFDKISQDDVARMSVQTGKYNHVIQQMAESLGATTVDFSNATLFTDPATLDSDGNHPNSKGYDSIADIWYRAIITP